MSSHAGDGAAGATWPQRDVDAESSDDDATESCWWRRCRGDLVVMRCRCRVMLVTALPVRLGRDVM
jgi:hypothetical protein